LADKVVLVANEDVYGSVELAKYYQRRRKIPEDHLIILKTSDQESITRSRYIEEIAHPILKKCIEKQWYNAIADNVDDHGRLVPIVFKKNIEYLVLFYGVPVKISEESELNDKSVRDEFFQGQNQSNFETGPLSKNASSIDGELSVLFLKSPPMKGFIPNPFFKESRKKRSDVLKVTRLDGPTPKSVRKMIKNGIDGELKGIRGRAYVDEDGRGNGYQQGNDWLKETAALWTKLGFSLSHNKNQRTFNVIDRFDSPALYAGWYALDLNGPFKLSDFSFPPGAVAVHLHSASANPLRVDNKRWAGPFIEKGVSATLGNTSEPYLALTHHLSVFFTALSDGYNFADAAYRALPGLSWQGVALGDPLFTPFKKSLKEQLKDAGDPIEFRHDQYTFLRKMNLSATPIEVGLTGMRTAPGPALILEMAQAHLEEGNNAAAIKALNLLRRINPEFSEDYILYSEIADLAAKISSFDIAFLIYQRLLTIPDLPAPVKRKFLQQASPIARQSNDFRQAIKWEEELTKLK